MYCRSERKIDDERVDHLTEPALLVSDEANI